MSAKAPGRGSALVNYAKRAGSLVPPRLSSAAMKVVSHGLLPRVAAYFPQPDLQHLSASLAARYQLQQLFQTEVGGVWQPYFERTSFALRRVLFGRMFQAASLRVPELASPDRTFLEKLILLTSAPPLQEVPCLASLRDFIQQSTRSAKVVVLGGGTGQANLIGGSSKQPSFREKPFRGLKERYPGVKAIVAVTDDGGATAKLLEAVPGISLGDLRHVLLSSMQADLLMKEYQLTHITQAKRLAQALFDLMNYRTGKEDPESIKDKLKAPRAFLLDGGQTLFPPRAIAYFTRLGKYFFEHPLLSQVDLTGNNIGNLYLAAAIYQESGTKDTPFPEAPTPEGTLRGIARMAEMLGVLPNGVLPVTTTAGHIKLRYSDGVVLVGEHTSAHLRRRFSVEQVTVDAVENSSTPPSGLAAIQDADVVVIGAGSLYTSILPVLQAVGSSVAQNKHAIKVIVPSLWTQEGETDISSEDSRRGYFASDYLGALHRNLSNVPGGIQTWADYLLFHDVRELPPEAIALYDLMEQKKPIWVDREKLDRLGRETIAANLVEVSREGGGTAVQHDPDRLAQAVQMIHFHHLYFEPPDQLVTRRQAPFPDDFGNHQRTSLSMSSVARPPFHIRASQLRAYLKQLSLVNEDAPDKRRTELYQILLAHPDIDIRHLQPIRGMVWVDGTTWDRERPAGWKDIPSYFDPKTQQLYLNQAPQAPLETAFFVGVGEAVLGDYAREKEKVAQVIDGMAVHVLNLTLNSREKRQGLLTDQALQRYLELTGFHPDALAAGNEMPTHWHRILPTGILPAERSFRPPGVYFGLFYAWYLDTRLVPEIDQEMSALRLVQMPGMTPAYREEIARLQQLIAFFRESVFQHHLSSL